MLTLEQIARLRAYERDIAWTRQYDQYIARKIWEAREPYDFRIGAYL